MELTDRQQQLLAELDRAPMLLGSGEYRASDAAVLFGEGLATTTPTHLQVTDAGRAHLEQAGAP